MTISAEAEAWRALPVRVADVIEPELDAATAEILAAIARDVPGYARPLEGDFGRGVRRGVSEALRQFVALIRDPAAGRGGREVYVELGRGELRQGRTLDSLQAAYRVGARVAWRRLSLAGREANLDAEVLSLLAEAIFAYIDELSADSVEGYAEAQAELEDQRRRRTAELAALLVREPPAEQADVRAAAEIGGWAPPGRVAALALPEAALGPVARRLPADSLATVLDGGGCVLFPDPEGPGRTALLEQAAEAAADFPLAQGPTGALGDLPASWALAKATLRAVQAGALPPATGLVSAEDRLADLLLFEGSALATRIAARRLEPLEALTEKARERMRETALAYVRHGGNAVAMAGVLHVHPQTARYRTARLRELLGDQLEDPDARFELEIALRHQGGGSPVGRRAN
ncbi:MAG TPA: helix-turn-helix domain-containing protein [Solirubrobacterales bacterium]|nr:helix-turn-helix domain-containing protein [Solirubrobacterales bacterium]